MKNEKKGLLERLTGIKKGKKSSCCGGFEIEEIPEENVETNNPKKSNEEKGNTCCK